MIRKTSHHRIVMTILTFAVMLPVFCPTIAKANDIHTDEVLLLEKPAANWEKEAFPLGNGRLGCMVFGGLEEERIQFNVDSLWTGDENLSGNYRAPGMGSYQNFGDLYVALDARGPAKNYRRELNIAGAVCRVAYEQDGTEFVRETFCSHPDQVAVSRMTANAKGKYSGHIRLVGGRKEKTSAQSDRLAFTGTLINGMDYEAQVLVAVEGGTIKADGETLVFSGCDSLTVTLAAGTSYVMDYARNWKGDHPHALVARQVEQAAGQSYSKLLTVHVEDHRSLYNRVVIDLGGTDEARLAMPIDRRLEAIREGKTDPDLDALLFQYGRYLLIACSRPGTLPANLQGLWNHTNNPPWYADYHSNINVQMNYWLAESANLAECHRPLFDLLTASLEPFRKATKLSYGENIRGFTIRTSHNPFGGMGWKWNIPASAWYARHFWEHYAFGRDKKFLETVAYPYLKEVCHYWEDHLKTLPDGRLVAPNGWSPEHGPTEDGVSHDQQIIWDLFTNTIEAADELGVDEDYRKKLSGMRDKLVGPKIGKWGQLQEWMEDRDDPNDHHRHISHIFALHPGRQISPLTTPELADAARTTVNGRGDGGTGWSKAWKINIWARLHDGNRAHKLLTEMIRGNIYDNLFDTHPPFQIDGNFGYTSGVCEMLLQSHAGEIHLLPALPDAWATGSVKGLCARGGFEVDIQWKEGELVSATIHSRTGTDCIVRYKGKKLDLDIKTGEKVELSGLLKVDAAEDLNNGFGETTIHGKEIDGKFVLDSAEIYPLVDPRTVDDPELPRVLVVGDSISMNYHNAAKAALKGKANYYRVEGNGGPSDHGVSNMELWLGDYTKKGLQWDVIQFNHGLHDLKQPYDKTKDSWGDYQVSIEDYKKNLEKEIQIMKKTGAKLIWCSTTPVPNSSGGIYARRKGEAEVFNKAAMEVISKYPEIQVNDLHKFISESRAFDKWRKGTDVHFRDMDLQGLVGKAVADAITKALPFVPIEILREDFLDWKYGMFIHFNVATYNEREWASGYEDPASFAGDKLDCNQWADAAGAAGMKYAVLTVKHTGGWCLWDSEHTSSHDMTAFKNYKNGKGDIVREFVDAFRKRRIKVGLYYCFPGDYARGGNLPKDKEDLHGLPPEAKGDYTGFIKKQLSELLTRYGPIDLLWADQYSNSYTRDDWQEIKRHIKSLQPNCIVIANNSLDFRDTDIQSYEYPWLKVKRPAKALPPEDNEHPSEVCDKIGPGWFWNTRENSANLKTAEEVAAMVNLCNSRRANYLLNVAPDRSGLIPAYSVERLLQAGKLLRAKTRTGSFSAKEYHVSTTGFDGSGGTKSKLFKTISRAADGEIFKVQGRTAFLIMPKNVAPGVPVPWVFYAPTIGKHPDVTENWMFEQFIDNGIAIAGVDVGESQGNPEGRAVYSALYKELVEKRRLAKKASLLARSRGGLMLYNWAAENPECIACIAGIYPVGNLASYPGMERAAKAYGMNLEQLTAVLPRHNPIDRLAPLAKAKIPIYHFHGDKDATVPLDKNSGIIKERYNKLGGKMILEVVKGGGHDLWKGWFHNKKLVNFVIANARPAEAGVSVGDLRCEYLTDPLGVDVLPRFSWKIYDSDKTRGQKQTACQIVVRADAPDGIDAKVDLWDSEKVNSSTSVNTEYAGGPLKSNQNCYWKVRIWDKDGKVTAWSPEARFSVGLLKPSDWKGDWIRYKEADEVKHIWYRKNFSLTTVPLRAFVHLASIGYHELYVNGERIGTRILSPGVTNLEKRVLYVTYDIAGQLKKGDNVVAVWTGPGWARADGSYGKGVWKQDSLFRCQVDMSNGVSFHTDSSWRCKESSSENLGLWKGGGRGEYGGEIIDARKYIPDWNKASYDDSDWANATAYAKSIILTAELMEPDRKVEVLWPVEMTENEGYYTFDMGRNFTGWLEMKLRNGKAGETVKFTTANDPGQKIQFKQESHYIHDDSGEGTFSHRFNYMAGRWVSVEGLSYKPKMTDVKCYIVTNDRKRIGSFECSKKLFNDIYETDLNTYIANTVNGVTTDCPHRERYGYGEITLACSWGCGIPNYESAPYYSKNTRDWYDVQSEDGFVNTIAPQVYKGAGGTLWSSAPVTLTWEFYKAYGDKRKLAEGYHSMKKWLDYLNNYISEDGVLTAYEKASRFLGDWATPHGSEYGDIPAAKLFNNCVYAYNLNVFVQAAEILGKPEVAAAYSARLAELRKNAHKHFFNEETKTYIDGRQLSMAFPLYTGITPDHERKAVFANFVEEITKNKPYLDTGSPGLPILLKYIIEDVERVDLLYHCLARTEHPGYGYFLSEGQTTWPEYWQIEGHASKIHTCYTSIAGYFTKGIGGILPDPASYGMKNFIIKPNLVGDLTYANTTSGSYYGSIVSNWSRSANNGKFHIEIPPNTMAKVYIPAKDVNDVLEAGQPAAKAKGVTYFDKDGIYAIFLVDSGEYEFSSSSVPSANT
jgi:alpha-L-fucosidase